MSDNWPDWNECECSEWEDNWDDSDANWEPEDTYHYNEYYDPDDPNWDLDAADEMARIGEED